MTRPTRTVRRLLPALAALALLGVGAGPAHAASSLTLATTTHGPMFDGSDAEVAAALQRARSDGVRVLRVYTSWEAIAPGGTVRPAGFNASDPGSPYYRWGGIDRIVRAATSLGIEPVLSVQEAPRWAERGGSGPPSTNNPDPGAFAEFAYAAAARYSGSYAGLPRVRYYQVWNEPNFDGYLYPQFDGSGRVVSTGIYRDLVNALAGSVKAVHGDDLVIAGGLASFSKPGHSVGPLDFMRQLLCMSGGRRPTSVCQQSIRFDVWAVDPYTVGNAFHKSVSQGGVSLGDLPTMGNLLRAATRAGQIQHTIPVQYWITEFGWDSNPPDPAATPLGQLMRTVPESLYQAWRSGVSVYTWYTLQDDAMSDTPFQSGLYFLDGSAKPFLGALRFPFVAYRRGRHRVYIWGITPDDQRARVSIEQQAGRGYRRLAWLRTNTHGIFSRTLRTSSRRPLRATVPGVGSSFDFALVRTPDTQYPVFGTGS